MKKEDLIKKCIKNDREAQSELFRQYKDALFLLSLKYCRNEVDAEDNLHDAFITIFQKIKTYKNKGSFEGWMKRITIYKAIDSFKAKRTTPIEINNDILKEDTTVDAELMNLNLDVILKLIQELPDQYRLVFNLYQMDGFSHKEVAKMLDISENTSKSNYHRSKLILRGKILELSVSTKTKLASHDE